VSKKRGTFGIHLGLVLAELMCVSAFVFELTRALAGNTLSWAYVFEWPILAFYGVYMWRTMLRDERRERDRTPAPEPEDDPRLAEWNEYLEKIHSSD